MEVPHIPTGGDLQVDYSLKNKFRWDWLQRTDVNGDLAGEYVVKLNKPGIAKCIWCHYDIKYDTSGVKSIKDHAKSKKHKAMREVMKTMKTMKTETLDNTEIQSIEDHAKNKKDKAMSEILETIKTETLDTTEIQSIEDHAKSKKDKAMGEILETIKTETLDNTEIQSIEDHAKNKKDKAMSEILETIKTETLDSTETPPVPCCQQTMALKPDQERVKNLLTDTVTLLCKNGLTFNVQMKVEAVIGVTVDKEVFIVHVNETFKNPEAPKSSSPDVEASDEPPPNLREKQRSAERRRQTAAAASAAKNHPHEVFVDLTGRDTPGPVRSSPHRQGRLTSGSSPSARSPRMSTPPTTPGRRGPYSPYATNSPRTPTGRQQVTSSRFRSPTMYPPGHVQMSGGRGGRYMSPQHVRGSYSPRQTFSPMQQSPRVRRSLNAAMTQGSMPPPSMQGVSHRQGSPVQARRTNGDEVIVLDEPATGRQSTDQRRVIGQMTTTPQTDREPLTIEPVTIEPEAPQETTSGSPEPPATATTPPSQDSAAATTEASASSSPKPDENTDLEMTCTGSPAVEDTPMLTESEEAIDDSLSRLASVIGDQQRARVAASDSSPSTPKSSASPDPRPPESTTPTSFTTRATPPAAATEATIAALEEVAKSTVEELQKTGAAETPPPSSTQGSVTSPTTDSGEEVPALSVCSIEGNFTRYDNLDTFKAVKKPPPDDSPDPEDAPPAKRRALSPDTGCTTDTTTTSTTTTGETSDGHNGLTTVKEVKSEGEDKKPQTSVMETSPSEKTNLSTWQVRELLESQIVTPVLRKQESTVTAFRVTWRGDADDVTSAWRDVAARRKELDDVVAKEKNLSFFISSVTAENAPAASFPCVGFWVVTRHPAFSKDALLDEVRRACGAGELKPVLKADGGSLDEFGALCQMVKDYGDGMVQRRVAESARRAGWPNAPPTVRFVLREKFFEHMLKNAMKQLRPASFTASLEKII